MQTTVINGVMNKHEHRIRHYDREFIYRFEQYQRVKRQLRELKDRPDRTAYNKLKRIAKEIKKLQIEYRQIIIPFNKRFCANCKTCCCRRPIGYLEYDDYVYYEILGVKLPDTIIRSRLDRCMFLDKANGCLIPEHLRPKTCILAYTTCYWFLGEAIMQKENKRLNKDILMSKEIFKQLEQIARKLNRRYEKLYLIVNPLNEDD